MKIILTLAIIILFPFFLIGQHSTDILAKRESTEEAIKITASLLEEARKDETVSLNRLKLINAQINNRNSLIKSLQDEYNLFDEFTRINSEVLEILREDLAALKEEYGSLMRVSQKSKGNNKMVVFIFSSENLNQAYKRLQYVRQYTQRRKQQMEIIDVISKLIDNNTVRLQQQKEKKTALIQARQRENILLQKEKIEQDESIRQLRNNQAKLMTTLREQESEQEELEKLIAKTLEDQENNTKKDLTEHKILTDDFKNNKGRLPWPVDRGVVVNSFGVSSHPLLKEVPIKNNGIDIVAGTGFKAKAVFPGEVSRIFTLTGGNISVILRHGSFLTLYANLSEVYVRVGQKVDLRQELGQIYTDPGDNKTILKFQVWEENRKQDPQEWLVRY